MKNISLAELRAAGVTPEPDEAVAITQLLIKTAAAADDPESERAFCAPSCETVFLNTDGSVWCRGGKPMRSASDAGVFLHALLPAGSPGVPDDLRHTIVCGLLSVEVPGVDSLDEFSRELARCERGDRSDAVRRVLERAGITVIPVSVPLRRSDAASAGAVPIRGRVMMTTAAACVMAGLALIASGGSTRGRAPAVQTTIAQAPEPAPAPEPPVTAAAATEPRPETPPNASRPRVRRAAMKRVTRPEAETAVAPPSSPAPRRGVLDRLHMGWLRKIVVRDDL